jgi:heme-degrading monooxygenase HmoA
MAAGAMVLEITRIDVMPGTAGEFRRAVARAQPIFSAAKGCRSVRLMQMVEADNAFLLLVEWERLEDHTVDFWVSDGFRDWRERVGGFFASPPRVEHGTAGLVIMDGGGA